MILVELIHTDFHTSFSLLRFYREGIIQLRKWYAIEK